MKITLVPEQMVLEVFAIILTKGVTLVVTFIASVFELPVEDVAHAALDVKVHVIKSPSAKVLFE